MHKKIAAIVQRGVNDDGDCGDPTGETEAESGGDSTSEDFIHRCSSFDGRVGDWPTTASPSVADFSKANINSVRVYGYTNRCSADRVRLLEVKDNVLLVGIGIPSAVGRAVPPKLALRRLSPQIQSSAGNGLYRS